MVIYIKSGDRLYTSIGGVIYEIPTNSNIGGTLNQEYYNVSKDLREDILKKNKDLTKHMETIEETYKNSNNIIHLTNEDFINGTYVISEPGLYIVDEDITFNPNNYSYMLSSEAEDLRTANGLMINEIKKCDTSKVYPSQFGKYDPKAYGLGFFAMIAITVENVVLDLNGKKIEQSVEHNLQQRFFSVLELADQPFLNSQGPHSFGEEIDSATNVWVKNGTLGRSSHHGIHGNNNVNVLLTDLKFDDFEVSPVALNKVDGLHCNNLNIIKNNQTIPVKAVWSSARFIKPYVQEMYNRMEELNVGSPFTINGKTIETVKENLENTLINVYDLVLSGNFNEENLNEDYKVFGNPTGLIDGNGYGILINSGGVAVNDFPVTRESVSKNVYLNNVSVNNMLVNVEEIPALKNEEDKAMNDPVGAVFQTQNTYNGELLTIYENGLYKGTSISDAQLLVAKAIHNGFEFSLSTKRNSISERVIEWVDEIASMEEIDGPGIYESDMHPQLSVYNRFTFIGNGDCMHHVNKGLVCYKMDAGENIYMENCNINKCKNIGLMGSKLANDNIAYKNILGTSHGKSTKFGYTGCNARGISVCSSKNVYISNSEIRNISSDYGKVVGVDVHEISENVFVDTCQTICLKAGVLSDIELLDENPTVRPIAIGYRDGDKAKNVVFNNVECSELSGLKTYCKLIEE